MARSDFGSIFDIPPDEELEARLDAEADYAAGRVISHESMRRWLTALAEGTKVLPPFI